MALIIKGNQRYVDRRRVSKKPPSPSDDVNYLTPTRTQRPPTPGRSLPRSLNDTPIIPVAGVSVNDLVDTFGAARGGGSRSHKGVDIFASEGTPVLSTVSGTVTKAGSSGGNAGLRVWVKDSNGHYHFFAHLSNVHVRSGMKVTAGQVIGRVGKTGNARSTPPHLHYSISRTDSAEDPVVNPFLYLKNGGITGDPNQLMRFTSRFTLGDMSMPSDDDESEMDDIQEDEFDQTAFFNSFVMDLLDGVSNVLAGGERVDPDSFAAPFDESEGIEAQQTPDPLETEEEIV